MIDWASLSDQGRRQRDPGHDHDFTMEVTPQLILVTLIGLAIQYIYFVGFWTSGWQARRSPCAA